MLDGSGQALDVVEEGVVVQGRDVAAEDEGLDLDNVGGVDGEGVGVDGGGLLGGLVHGVLQVGMGGCLKLRVGLPDGDRGGLARGRRDKREVGGVAPVAVSEPEAASSGLIHGDTVYGALGVIPHPRSGGLDVERVAGFHHAPLDHHGAFVGALGARRLFGRLRRGYLGPGDGLEGPALRGCVGPRPRTEGRPLEVRHPDRVGAGNGQVGVADEPQLFGWAGGERGATFPDTKDVPGPEGPLTAGV